MNIHGPFTCRSSIIASVAAATNAAAAGSQQPALILLGHSPADQPRVRDTSEAELTLPRAKPLASNASFYTIKRHNCLHFIVEWGGLAAMHQIRQLQGKTDTPACVPQPVDAKSSPAWKEWQRTFDAIDDFVTILDLERRVLRTNKAIAEFGR